MEIARSGIVNRYVAAQGPLPVTTADFWLMVWEQRSSLIVMLTTESERGRVKCHQYWPEPYAGATRYSNFTVTAVREDIRPQFAYRDFTVVSYSEEFLFTCSVLKHRWSSRRRRRHRFWHATQDCIAPYVDHILHRDQFWVHCFRWCEIVGSQILLYDAQPCDAGHPWGLLQSSGGRVDSNLLVSALLSICTMCPTRVRWRDWTIAEVLGTLN